MNAMFEMQRNAIQQSQQMMQQGIDMQQRMTESMMRNNLSSGHNAQRQGTELARNWMDAYFRTLGTMFGRGDASEVSESLREQFEEFNDAQDDAWDSFEDSLDQAMDAYEDLNESQKELIDRSFNSFFEMQRETGERVADAAEQMERQAQESQSTTGSSSSSSSTSSSGSSSSS
ncbi:hypothetical protein [Halorussus rarus]|nr:hypothetical protein [Halorussus rarus]